MKLTELIRMILLEIFQLKELRRIKIKKKLLMMNFTLDKNRQNNLKIDKGFGNKGLFEF